VKRSAAGVSAVLLTVALAGCGGLTAQDTTGPGDASADTAPIQATLDATTDSFESVEAAMDTTTGDDRGALDSSIDTASDSATADAPDEAADARICVPATCATFGHLFDCGYAADGCGNAIFCGTCIAPEFCGGGAAPSTCGGNLSDAGSTMSCMPTTCAALGNPCGSQGDGCGGLLTCTTCPAGETCGGGGPNLCGGSGGTDGGADGGGGQCNPKRCTSYPANACGAQSDGCGGLTANCGTCTSPAFCGGNPAAPGTCGGNNGMSADGAVASLCVPNTCQSLHYNCGQAGDGCGGTIDCNPASGAPACNPPQVCGGGGTANVCGSNLACTGLCQQQVACDGGATTTLTGIVRSGLQEGATSWVPAGTVPDPVPGVLVYIPTTALTPFDSNPNAPQVQCSQCGADVSGNPLVEATTDYTGKFTLTNVPVSTSASNTIPIVIQLGHWRREYEFAILNPCVPNALPQDLNLPSSSTEGDIPLTAISTGSYDPIECVLLKMGINQNEFMSYTTWAAETANGTAPKQGRVHIYTATGGGGFGNANPGSKLAPQLDETALLGTAAGGNSATNGNYMIYDQILLPCWGGPATKNASELFDLGYYGDHGGHFFATHFSYTWLSGNTNSMLTSVANWDLRADDNIGGGVNGTAFTGDVSNAVPPPVATPPGVFVQWLNYVGALSNGNPGGAPPAAPTVTITAGRHDVDSVANGSVEWIDGTDPNGVVNSSANPPTAEMLLHFTFDMPIGATSGQCGHGIFSDFHVNSASQSNNTTFPNECNTQALNSQERIIEYMIWDLSSCVPGPPTATCTPKTCMQQNIACGPAGDGCGNLIAGGCGSCPTGQTCGGGGVSGQCGAAPVDGGTCTAETCASYPGQCGQQSDGCGNLTANCTCPAGQSCNSGVCSPPSDGGSTGCVPLTCASYPAGTCGEQSDGCGNLTPDCNPCTPPQTCGGAGVANQCGMPPATSCMPQPCPSSIMCGPASDGCGGVIASCGTCTPPQTCGGGGTSGVCGGNSGCVPETCGQQSIACGPAGDGCGNVIQCGPCPAGQTCGGGGVSGQCGGGSMCVPKTCAELNITCGPAGDGCGNLIATCGTCTPPATCGGGGVSGQCGSPVAQ